MATYSDSNSSRVTPVNQVFSAGTLQGARVHNQTGEDLGKIEEIMLDPDTGDIAYAVLSFGGFLGMGDKLFAIPWRALQFHGNTREVFLDIDKSRLENAPGFDKDHWPNMADPTWSEDLHDYYNQEPYWEAIAYTARFTTGRRAPNGDEAARRERLNAPDLPEEIRRRPIDVTSFPGREKDMDLKTSDPTRTYAVNDSNRWTRR